MEVGVQSKIVVKENFGVGLSGHPINNSEIKL